MYVGVDGEVEEVVLLGVGLVKQFDKHVSGVLVGDVLHHHGCPSVEFNLSEGRVTLLRSMSKPL